MSNQATFEVATLDLLKHLKSKKEAMQVRHASELAEIDKEIEAVSITMRLLRETVDSSERTEESKPAVIPNDLNGKSTRQACIEIAKRNNGVVFVGEAKKALVASRILKESKNTWAIIYTTLRRSKEFEKTSVSGGFRLISPPKEQRSLLQ
jgi:hypothetical protein